MSWNFGVRQADDVGKTAVQGGAGLLSYPLLERMGGALHLSHRVFHRVPALGVGLIPGAIFHTDQPALDLDGCQSDSGPQDEQVDLVLHGTVAHRYRMGEHRVIGQRTTQLLPHRLFRRLAI